MATIFGFISMLGLRKLEPTSLWLSIWVGQLVISKQFVCHHLVQIYKIMRELLELTALKVVFETVKTIKTTLVCILSISLNKNKMCIFRSRRPTLSQN